ncbi:unnamed protein product [Acanthocheilonema viteae]|uniref:Uncharacterized protein n=1 Tax=Acanthocheilonema viteae TaxID=6277 RepID=A0A498SVU9_ACAVI|nr:unnamed protein product [Acanthocheilonema viteae]
MVQTILLIRVGIEGSDAWEFLGGSNRIEEGTGSWKLLQQRGHRQAQHHQSSSSPSPSLSSSPSSSPLAPLIPAAIPMCTPFY